MMIIGVCGLARSGKDTVADYLDSHYGFHKLVMSDVLKSELILRKKETTKKNMLELGNELRKAKGHDIVARMVYERCKGLEKITIVGFRSPSEVDFFQKASDKFFLVEVRAPKSTRVKRANELGREDVSFRDSDDILKKGLDGVFSMASVVIDNDSSLENLHTHIAEEMNEIGYAHGD